MNTPTVDWTDDELRNYAIGRFPELPVVHLELYGAINDDTPDMAKIENRIVTRYKRRYPHLKLPDTPKTKTELRMSSLTVNRLMEVDRSTVQRKQISENREAFTIFGMKIILDPSMNPDEIKIEYREENFEEMWERTGRTGRSILTFGDGTKHKVILNEISNRH